jgi:hypothetical protein
MSEQARQARLRVKSTVPVTPSQVTHHNDQGGFWISTHKTTGSSLVRDSTSTLDDVEEWLND